MKLLSTTDFYAETMGGRPNKIDMSTYEGYSFECSCGKTHMFFSGQVNVLRELPKMRLVFECPDQPIYVTCVKVKGMFSFKGFESLFGAKIEGDLDIMQTLEDAFERRTGIKLTEEQTQGEKIKEIADEYEHIKQQLADEVKKSLKTKEEMVTLESLSHLTFEELIDLGKNSDQLTEQGVSVYNLFMTKIKSHFDIP